MKKIVFIFAILIAAVLGWLFFTGQDDPEMQAIRDDATNVATRITDKAKADAEAIRKRVMDKQGIELHSDAKTLTLEHPVIEDIRYHFWRDNYGTTNYFADNKVYQIFSSGNVVVYDYEVYTSCSEKTINPNGKGFQFDSGMCWDLFSVENDVLTFSSGLSDFWISTRVTGEAAAKAQSAVDAELSKSAN